MINTGEILANLYKFDIFQAEKSWINTIKPCDQDMVKKQEEKKPPADRQNAHRLPENSTFYDRVVPALFVGLGIILVILILVALGILVGLVPIG